MSFLGWIILGLIAGLVGKAVIKGTGVAGWATLGVGVIGALLGGGVAALFGAPIKEFWSIGSWAAAIIGAIVVLFAYKYVSENYLNQDKAKGSGDHQKLT